MIEILPITDEKARKEYCDEHNIPAESAVMLATDSGENLGGVAAHVSQGELYINLLETPYEWMKDGLIKAILAYGDNRFLTVAKTGLVEHKTAFEKVGFKEEDGILQIEISKVIHNCKP